MALPPYHTPHSPSTHRSSLAPAPQERAVGAHARRVYDDDHRPFVRRAAAAAAAAAAAHLAARPQPVRVLVVGVPPGLPQRSHTDPVRQHEEATDGRNRPQHAIDGEGVAPCVSDGRPDLGDEDGRQECQGGAHCARVGTETRVRSLASSTSLAGHALMKQMTTRSSVSSITNTSMTRPKTTPAGQITLGVKAWGEADPCTAAFPPPRSTHRRGLQRR